MSTLDAESLPSSASCAQWRERLSLMTFASFSSRLMVLGDTVRPVCSYTIEALMSAVRMPLRSGFSARRRSASSPSASVARARSVTVRARTK